MHTKKSAQPVNPNLERSPEPFPKVTTIPDGWDLSEFLDPKLDNGSQKAAPGAAAGDKVMAL